MNEEQFHRARTIITAHPEAVLAYVFGSQATGRAGPMSDYDFAVYLNLRDAKTMFDIKFMLEAELGVLLKTDRVDVVIMNLAESPELKYGIIAEGKLLYERAPFKMLVEPRIMNEYFDFSALLRRHGLTRARP